MTNKNYNMCLMSLLLVLLSLVVSTSVFASQSKSESAFSWKITGYIEDVGK